ncbi:MAG: tRNA (adenosine(37)-N6)-dimethylallyltransferase MiaA [Desulfuromonas sp.]|nr:tRNA (adenosine(37)-N6)-dimethylallyltransferase MiaA [Desulfuromonas sp.]
MRNDTRIPLLVVCGPTASGKTGLAVKLAQKYPVEVVSADSRQVYRQMDIGTAKATTEERQAVTHHLIDVVNPDEKFSVADFSEHAHEAIAQIHARGNLPLVVGGTGLYIRALTDGLLDLPGEDAVLRQQLLDREQRNMGSVHRLLQQCDPVLAEKLHPHDITRIIRGIEVFETTGVALSRWQSEHGFREQPYRVLKLAVTMDRALLYQRINDRVELMIKQGVLDETRFLLAQGYHPNLKSMRTIGYRQAIAHLREGMSLDDAVAWIQQDSRRYAKRQLTWFRKDKSIIWVDYKSEFDNILAWIENFYLNAH